MTEPIYQKIMRLISEEIQDQEPNTPILSERELEKKYKASRMTVRKAIDRLVEEGVLYRIQNVGTFVSDQKLHKKELTEIIAETFDPDRNYRILHFKVKANSKIAEILGAEENEPLLQIVRLNMAKDGKPEGIDEIYLVNRSVEEMHLNNIRDILEFSAKMNKNNRGSVNQRLIPMAVPMQYANLLKIKINTPLLRIDSTVNTLDGKVYAFVSSYISPEKNIEVTI